MSHPTILIAFAAVAAVAVDGTAASAQAAPKLPALELSAQVGRLPIYDGDATVGSISTWAPSARIAYRLPLGLQTIAVEAYLAHVSQDNNPYNRVPAFTFVGALARLSLRDDPRQGVDPFLGFGVGRMRVDVEERETECLPPNCFAEGGHNFLDARLTTLTLDAGVLVPLVRWAALRGDVRLYMPRGNSADVGDSAHRRIEYAVGASFRL